MVVEPNEADELAIVEGKDYVTLLTCTPYGVNSHRMLVRGHRIDFVPEDIKEQASEHVIADRDKPIYILAIAVIVLIIIMIIMGIIKRRKEREKKGVQ